jgi:hypothetical protein
VDVTHLAGNCIPLAVLNLLVCLPSCHAGEANSVEERLVALEDRVTEELQV